MDLGDLDTDGDAGGFVGLRWRLWIAGLCALLGAAVGGAIAWADGVWNVVTTGGTGALIAGGLAFAFPGYVIIVVLLLGVAALWLLWTSLGLGAA